MKKLSAIFTAPLKVCLVVALWLCTMAAARAQQGFTLSGNLTDSLGKPVPAATVFIVGMTKITSANAQGAFSFSGLQPGTYELAVSLLGYARHTEVVFITDSNVHKNITLHAQAIMLTEVVVGDAKAFDRNFKMFTKAFLGNSKNARGCTIVNPEVLQMKYSKKQETLTVTAPEFLEIKNEALGYKVKYQLNKFLYNPTEDNAQIDGSAIFEELPGTPKQKQKWAEARREAYQGSLMHFFRAVYYKKVRDEGFLVHQAYELVPAVLTLNDGHNWVYVNPQPLDMNVVTQHGEKGMMQLRFIKIYVSYNPAKAAKTAEEKEPTGKKQAALDGRSSLIRMVTDNAIIDQKGNTSGSYNFTMNGALAKRRVADLLPYEYWPE